MCRLQLLLWGLILLCVGFERLQHPFYLNVFWVLCRRGTCLWAWGIRAHHWYCQMGLTLYSGVEGVKSWGWCYTWAVGYSGLSLSGTLQGRGGRLQSRQLIIYVFWSVYQVEDFVDPNGKIYLQREETPSNRWVVRWPMAVLFVPKLENNTISCFLTGAGVFWFSVVNLQCWVLLVGSPSVGRSNLVWEGHLQRHRRQNEWLWNA